MGWIQRRDVRFVARDYKSRDSGCVTRMLKDLDLHSGVLRGWSAPPPFRPKFAMHIILIGEKINNLTQNLYLYVKKCKFPKMFCSLRSPKLFLFFSALFTHLVNGIIELLLIHIYISITKSTCIKQNRSTEGCSKLKRSVDMTSSGKNGLNFRTNASPKRDRTRCPEE